ncbi:MAG TPA: EAL domain-containing protein [Terracidiphilus sp.]|nr:EAL domain-containing protein [Terracidiphilus sp.]
MASQAKQARVGLAKTPSEATGLKLPDNAELSKQREILDALPVLVFLERAGIIVFANLEARQMLGLTEGEWVERPVEDVLWGLFPGTAEPQTLLTGTRKGSPFHATMPAKDGKLEPVEGTYSIFDAALREAVIVAHPGGRGRAPKSQLMDDVLASIPEAVAIEYGNHLLYTNPAFTRMFGYTAEEAGGGSLRGLIVPETRLNEHTMLEKGVDEQGRVTLETVRANKAGELVDVSLQCAPLLVNNAKVGYVYTFRDVGERKHTEEKLTHDAMHDVLTGLPNRALFLDRLSLALARRARRPDQNCGVLFIDLDRFKEINDVLGHAAGDAVLNAVAERLHLVLRPQDSAARLGGDEFAVLVEGIATSSDLESVAKRIMVEMLRPFELFENFVQAGASIGGAMAGPDHTSSDLLIRDADFAMYRAKQSGGGRYEIFDKHLEVVVTSQQERERELRYRLDKHLIEFFYQPILRLQDGRLEGFECLLRWRRPDGSIDNFSDLMTVAEETGLSIQLGRETMEAASWQLRNWHNALPHVNISISVNLTQRQFYDRDLVLQLQRTLAASGADPSRLLFEVPEGALNEGPDAAVAILQRMVDCNVRVAIDSFGSSLAPLNHLVRLPIDQIKLDPKLTVAATSTGRQQMVLESLLRLGQTLGVQVVAQGIETPEQLRALGRMGCQLGQGPLLSPALEASQAAKLAELGYLTLAP